MFVLRERSQLSVCDQQRPALLHCVTAQRHVRHTYMTCLWHTFTKTKHYTQMKNWIYWHVEWCTQAHVHATHTTRPEEGWVWWQSQSLCQCHSLKRNEAEWHRLPSGDTQPVITKWHKRPTLLTSKSLPIVSTSSSEFVHYFTFF